ncbi:conserved hypothetical protein [Leishmania infantum JPCM5]|uniref:Uncharacterized protein n=2 Tax=Leishmania infantum TaxID=5671 RepID=E9AGI8_LEIIN|nr:conserved hypothetical protein [Leishmania infantum JPCM5]CAC9464159.1 hypothetical_protein_-_conserved [Leishmania infantum]CBZ08488.1 conserved hypothetical protein [Leishmania infantum JPCM5]SUZ40040.1 hypothetical_protein_-_conserved [Leishmania infantum]|eukprot:XP_003392340.1 conserved hypothetical protein [Leishmania infantum JPCM5]
MLHLTSEPQKKKGPAVPECSRFLLGLALLLTIISDGAMNSQFTALSTIITANSDPSALQQLATFAAMEDVAEEEHLDWGSTARLVQAQPTSPAKPRNAMPPDPTTLGSVSAHAHSRTDSENMLSDGLSKSLTDISTNGVVGNSSAASSSSSRRRPHRRHHRRSGTVSDVPSKDDATAALSASRPVHSYHMWTQFHVMEMAYSTGSNNFVHITERFLEYQQMFPIVYCCDVNKVDCPYEAELLASPKVGLAASSRWSCENCGKRHNVVRESCLRCRAPGMYSKLFIGQAVKEVGCTESLVRFFYATHPDIVIHRAECHHDTDADALQRGKGCASIYVRREDAALLQQKLHRNAFFDVDSVTEQLLVYYVYAEQQQWLHSYAQQRNAGMRKRPLFLPLSPLVVEESASSSAPARRVTGHGQGRRRQSIPDSTSLPSERAVH